MADFHVEVALRRLRKCGYSMALFVILLISAYVFSSFTYGSQVRGCAGETNAFAGRQLQNNLRQYHLPDEEAEILNKAAEFGIQRFSEPNKRAKLRSILGFEKEPVSENEMLYKLHVLYQEERGPLKDKNFDVYVHRDRTGGVKFKLKAKQSNGKRTPREANGNKSCDQLSREANCSSCGFHGICAQGAARISPWLQFALKTQRELQIDVPVNHVQVLGAHNSFNNRASGYGDLDDCHWPLRANDVCISLANQEFSFTDQLSMGIRHFEIDLWECFGKIRMSHGNSRMKLGCLPWDKEFTEGMKEISDWTKKSGNRNEIIEIHFDDHTTDSQDWSINHDIKEYFGDKVFTPDDLKLNFSDRWPTIRKLRQMKKTVIFIDGNSHSGRYLHDHFWSKAFTVNAFSSTLENCSSAGINSQEIVRIYSDSTVYGPLWNGIKSTGNIMDFKKYLFCGVNIPCADQINSELMKTAVFTWAEGEPKQPINESSCVVLSSEGRWRQAQCSEDHYFACVSKEDENVWNVTSRVGKYNNPSCLGDMKFGVPHNGYQHQELVKTAKGKTVWINLTPFIPLLTS